MNDVCVEFADVTEAEIVGAFGCPQQLKSFPHQGIVSTGDPRWLEYYKSLPANVVWPVA